MAIPRTPIEFCFKLTSFHPEVASDASGNAHQRKLYFLPGRAGPQHPQQDGTLPATKRQKASSNLGSYGVQPGLAGVGS